MLSMVAKAIPPEDGGGAQLLPKSQDTEDYEEKDELKDLLQRSVLNLEQIDQNLYL